MAFADMAQGKGIEGHSLKPVFRALFQAAHSKEETRLRLLKTETLDSLGSGDGVFWWRRGPRGPPYLWTRR